MGVANFSDVSYFDVTITNGVSSFPIRLTDYVKEENAIIIGAGAISRDYKGWTGFNISYTNDTVTVTFGLDGSRVVNSDGNWKIRVWYQIASK